MKYAEKPQKQKQGPEVQNGRMKWKHNSIWTDNHSGLDTMYFTNDIKPCIEHNFLFQDHTMTFLFEFTWFISCIQNKCRDLTPFQYYVHSINSSRTVNYLPIVVPSTPSSHSGKLKRINTVPRGCNWDYSICIATVIK